MTHDQTQFFDLIRATIFGGELRRRQRNGIAIILDSWAGKHGDGDPRHLAYILATAFHETGRRMEPVRETFAGSDAAAIAILERAFRAGRLPGVKTPYWRPDALGQSWLGRGYVQLTHKRNYEAMSVIAGIDLVAAPDRAMEPEIAAIILIEGMMRGIFTGKKCADYLHGERPDWVGARRIVNGTDRAASIADHARQFHSALTAWRKPAGND